MQLTGHRLLGKAMVWLDPSKTQKMKVMVFSVMRMMRKSPHVRLNLLDIKMPHENMYRLKLLCSRSICSHSAEDRLSKKNRS